MPARLPSSLATPILDRFTRQLYARAFMVRSLEISAISTTASVLLAMLVGAWAGGSIGLVLGIALSCIALIAGMLISRATISRQMLLVNADEQLKLSDLLGTAHEIKNASAQEPWRDTILTLAEHRCSTLSPRSVTVGRLSDRMWGALGIVIVASAITMVFSHARTIASDERNALAREAKSEVELLTQAMSFDNPVTAFPSSRSKPNRRADPSHDEAANEESIATDASVSERATASQESGNQGQSRDSGEGSGSASSASSRKPLPTAVASGESLSDRGTTASGGSSKPGLDSRGAAGPAQGTVRPETPAAIAAPWKSSEWVINQEAAHAAVTSGAIAPRYRDLVREYFSATSDD